MFIIKWKSKQTGSTGRGTTRYTIEQAKAEVNRLNTEFPDIHHWYEEVPA